MNKDEYHNLPDNTILPGLTEAPKEVTAAPTQAVEEYVEAESPESDPAGEIPSISILPSGMQELPVIAEVTAIPLESAAVTEAPVENPSNAAENAVSKTSEEGDFYFAYFDVITEKNVKAAIPNLVVRLHGTVNSINPSDLTEVVLTLDGVPIGNGIVLTDKINQFRTYKNYATATFTAISSNVQAYPWIINEAVNAINEMGFYIPTLGSGDVPASVFISMRDSINSL
jgi:hypothetical protein